MLPLLLCTALALPTTLDDPPIPADTEITTTESGLKYSVLKKGEGGASPVLGDRVQVHYVGWLEDGTVFDSSRARGLPAEFGLGHVVEGWNEGLQLMQIGDSFKFTIPSDLGYGDEGTQGIAGGATLIFEVELLAITAKTLPHLTWPGSAAEGIAMTEAEVPYLTLEAGSGAKVEGCEVIAMEFAFWDPTGKVLVSDSLNGRSLLVSPTQMPFPFLQELVPNLAEGTHIHFRAKSSTMPGLGFDDYDEVDGQIRVIAAMDFKKPEFALPTDEELTTTESGLRYRIIRGGDQFRPGAQAQVAAHYAGWLTDGTQFDASYDRGSPLQGNLMSLIDGWKEGMRLVGRGGKIVLVVPSDLGYGD
ncbi:MAG: FKBP-type peptidyl-prolyl cis-trans isomerase, partial [Planctomycetota bacterium]|nr:FKBP-type peptidyl-prolyl cis-trans isomerase [Planctomycetota bacterium]